MIGIVRLNEGKLHVIGEWKKKVKIAFSSLFFPIAQVTHTFSLKIPETEQEHEEWKLLFIFHPFS